MQLATDEDNVNYTCHCISCIYFVDNKQAERIRACKFLSIIVILRILDYSLTLEHFNRFFKLLWEKSSDQTKLLNL